jgi:hypothetical protein
MLGLDEVLRDIIPMNALNLLFGQPQQYDRKLIHDGLKILKGSFRALTFKTH